MFKKCEVGAVAARKQEAEVEAEVELDAEVDAAIYHGAEGRMAGTHELEASVAKEHGAVGVSPSVGDAL